MKKYTRPIAKFHFLKSNRLMAGSDDLRVGDPNNSTAVTPDNFSKSTSISFDDED